jgi:hypothetical protein
MRLAELLRIAALATGLAICFHSTGCAAEEESLERRCDRLRDHLVDLRMEGVPVADQASHRVALRQALGEQFADQCKSMTAKQIDCGLGADEISAAAACASR